MAMESSQRLDSVATAAAEKSEAIDSASRETALPSVKQVAIFSVSNNLDTELWLGSTTVHVIALAFYPMHLQVTLQFSIYHHPAI